MKYHINTVIYHYILVNYSLVLRISFYKFINVIYVHFVHKMIQNMYFLINGNYEGSFPP